MAQHELDLRENAIDSLNEALRKFQDGENGDQKAYKFAVTHMAHFLELIFKDHLASRHPLLIYRDPFAKNLDLAKANTVTLWDVINFIKNEAQEDLSPELLEDLEWLKKLRNQIEHHKFTMNVDEVRKTIGRLFSAVVEFLDNFSDYSLEGSVEVDVFAAFKTLSDKHEFEVATAMRAAREVEESNPRHSPDDPPVRLVCDSCGYSTMVVNKASSTGYECTFCGECESDDLPATCDSCGAETTAGELRTWENEEGEKEGRCYYCSGQYSMDKAKYD